ncbi:MAG TPA: gamma carbonic anhydrase family protein [Syntrophorhabdaceae bacterium]|nr:gamma carbonic anhydrase family protein [Syntrophorhabdaceae bacterium]HPC66681.1 gamma carbonic anhydrase family protein [Syntrophorhabdaceae bacterium]HQE79487.1 gamma carbonic anhydrase family protein [Syntrophorhabdaceae bacterium]HQH42220.1 gamma carbonic anhydrase family protein [Syntrophorhabdaceae bacterium]HQK45390.1 gamma carbonic anhydrase family protein [Syntrophorhabdaceae bacterium]
MKKKGELSMNNNGFISDFEGIRPHINNGVYVDISARVIGNVILDEGSSIWPMAVLRADSAHIHIGRHAAVLDFAFIESPEGFPVNIGEEALISHGAMVHGAIIESRCLIGIGAIILDGAVISSGSIIGAGSFIAAGAHIPPNSLVMGTPGRVIREVKPGERDNLIQQIKLIYNKSRRYMGPDSTLKE